MGDDEALRRRVRLMRPPPDEAQLRQRYAVEAEAMGRGPCLAFSTTNP